MVVTEFHRRVDVARAGDPLFEHTHRFEAERHAQPARSKSRSIAHYDWFFLHAPGDFQSRRFGVFAGFLTDNDLEKLHDGHRIEEVHADDIAGSARGGGNLRN